MTLLYMSLSFLDIEGPPLTAESTEPIYLPESRDASRLPIEHAPFGESPSHLILPSVQSPKKLFETEVGGGRIWTLRITRFPAS